MKPNQILVAFLGLVLVSLLVTSCGTARGVGKDLQSVGRGIEKIAR